jgi:hypothetical protein
LQDTYQGLSDDVWDSWVLEVILGRQVHRVKVQNRIEPERFREVRERIEEFVQNELGLMALALSAERLTALGREAVLQGQKFYDERDVRLDNLSRAVAKFSEAAWYVETLEPKPEYYDTSVSGLEECRRLLQDRYEDQLFLAERAIKLRDWPTAAHHLRRIIEMIPDRSDARHTKVEKKLIDVERRMDR